MKSVPGQAARWVTDIRSKEEKKARNDVEEPLESRPRKKIVPIINRRPSSSRIPDPDSKGLDLQAMIEERRLLKMAEARRKKALNQNLLKLDH